jgi:hypothetical protein
MHGRNPRKRVTLKEVALNAASYDIFNKVTSQRKLTLGAAKCEKLRGDTN